VSREPEGARSEKGDGGQGSGVALSDISRAAALTPRQDVLPGAVSWKLRDLGKGEVEFVLEHGANELRRVFGEIDIYLFDQLLKGRITPEMTVLDAGCGGGRNIAYLMRSGCRVFGVDGSFDAIMEVRKLAAELAPDLPPEHFQVARVSELPFPEGQFDAVVCIAVLHFAADEDHFRKMLGELWRVLKPGGLLFSRLASSIGIEDRVESIEGRRCRLPDGTERFLVDEAMLLALTEELEGELLDPIKTTNVQGQRCMTTWVVGKGSGERGTVRSEQ
jgi:tellurite methyltransferase